MNINRNNYEEYFLLYADNELTQTEKKVVEIFLQENVDLKEEFLMIQMTINSPEKEMKLSDKSFLLKTEPAFINENNYEAIFVLYHDNELSEEQKKETEKFIAENPKFRSDFELIGKAKLVVDKSVIYQNKKELYRKEKSGKIVPLVLLRSFAAAIFIGFGIWVAASYFNKKEVSQPLTATIKNGLQKSAIKETKPDKKAAALEPKNEKETALSSSKVKEPKKINEEEPGLKKPVSKEEKIKKELIAKTEIKTKAGSTSKETKVVNSQDKYQIATIDEPLKKLSEKMPIDASSLLNNPATTEKSEIDANISKSNYAHTASYISDPDQKNDNYVFYDVPTEEFRKSKVGGFLKKVKRIVERTNPIARLLGEEDQLAAK
jgi:cytoskeletal protein RodZ